MVQFYMELDCNGTKRISKGSGSCKIFANNL